MPFKANYRQDPRIGFEGRKKGKYKGAEKFIEKMKEIQEEAKAALKGEKGTISLAQAKDAVPGPNCMLKSLWG